MSFCLNIELYCIVLMYCNVLYYIDCTVIAWLVLAWLGLAWLGSLAPDLIWQVVLTGPLVGPVFEKEVEQLAWKEAGTIQDMEKAKVSVPEEIR